VWVQQRDHPLPTLRVGALPCSCPEPHGLPDLVVVTGGPGAGKTAVLELAAQSVCRHVAILPEAASIIFGGGFPRHGSLPGRTATQAAIFAVQRQLEAVVIGEGQVSVALCDRGTVDGVVYWPSGAGDFWSAMGTTRDAELGRYQAVIHLEVPDAAEGYVTDPVRTESAQLAAEIDRAIAAVWEVHPHLDTVGAGPAFDVKAHLALTAIRATLPDCCREAAGSGHRAGPS
jgi:predicted ATPase